MSQNGQTAGETAIQVFSSEQFGVIRTAGTADEPLFCLADICKALDLRAPDVRQRLSDDVVSTHTATDAKGRINKLNFVTEDGLYDVILDSRKAEAKAFRKWVTAEVLPSIRKTGGYMVAKPDETPEEIMARALKVADDTLRRQQMRIEENEKTIKELEPLADYTKEVLQGDGTYTFTQVAKSLGFRGVAQFTDWLNGKGVVFRESRSWLPYADYATKEWFTTRTTKFVKSDGTVGTNMYTVITEKGRMGIRQLLAESQAKAMEGGAQ